MIFLFFQTEPNGLFLSFKYPWAPQVTDIVSAVRTIYEISPSFSPAPHSILNSPRRGMCGVCSALHHTSASSAARESSLARIVETMSFARACGRNGRRLLAVAHVVHSTVGPFILR